MIIGIGKAVNSISGLLNTITSLVMIVINNNDITDTTSYFYLLDSYVTAVDSQNLGIVIADIISDVFNIVVPSATQTY